MILSPSLFAHINNDAHLTGTRHLEGQQFENTVGFLSHFLNDVRLGNTAFPKELLQHSEIEQLEKKLHALAEVSRDINFLSREISLLSDKERMQKYLDFTTKTAKQIINIPNGNNQRSVFYPGGWTGMPSGHAMLYEFRKDKDGGLLFFIHNSGAGLHHHIKISTPDKNRYLPVKAYRIPKDAISEDRLKFFLSELTKPNVEPLLQDKEVVRSRKYDADRLYQSVIPQIAFLDGVEVDPRIVDPSLSEVMTMGQRSGTCAQKVLHELLKSTFADKKKLKLFLFSLKKYSIELFYNENIAQMDEKKVQQLGLAIENLARIFVKNPHLFSDELAKETHDYIKNIRIQLAQYQPKEEKHSIHPDLFEMMKFNVPIDIKYYSPKLSANAQSNVKVSRYKEKSVELYTILKGPLTAIKLERFSAELRKQQALLLHESVVDHIDELFLNMPLELEYYQEINTPDKAKEIIEKLTQLMAIYAQSCLKIDPSGMDFCSRLGPKRVIALLSVVGIIDQILKKEGITLSNKGISALLGRGFSSFLSNHINSSFLVTNDPNIDKRMLDLKKATFVEPYEHINTKLDLYSHFIQTCSQSEKFQDHLIQLFNDNADKIFTKEQIETIRENKKVKEVAFAVFLDENSWQFADYFKKSEVKKSAEGLLSGIFKAINYFDYERLNRAGKSYVSSTKYGVNYRDDLPDNRIEIRHKLKESSPQIENPNIQLVFDASFGDCNHLHRKKVWAYFDYDNYARDTFHPNRIYSFPNGHAPLGEKSSEPEYHTPETVYKKMMWELRAKPRSQILTTLDFFYEQTHLLKEKDYQVYFEKNIFQIGLLLEGMKENQNLSRLINDFIEYGKLYFSEESEMSSGNVFFRKLQYDFNHYLLEANLNDYRPIAINELRDLKSSFDSLLKLNLTPEERLLNLKFKIKINLDLLNYHGIEPDQENLYELFREYLAFKNLFKEKKEKSTPEYDEENEIKKRMLATFYRYQKTIPGFVMRWCKEYGIKLNANEITQWDNDYPHIIAKNKFGKTIVNLDLAEGDLWLDNYMIKSTPSNLSTSPIYEAFFGKKLLMTKIMPVIYQQNLLSQRQIQIMDDPNKSCFYETPFLDKPFVYQCAKTVDNSESIFELQMLLPPEKIGMTVEEKDKVFTSALGAQKAILSLPKSFFCESTKLWMGEKEALIEREDKTYCLDKTNDIIYELNIDKTDDKTCYVKTGYTLLKKESNERIYQLFSHFENKEFIEILENRGAKKGEPNIKVYFPRYNLLLHGYRDPKGEWRITNSTDENFELKENQLNPFEQFKAPLVFENKENKETVAIIPMQEFYIKNSQAKKTSAAKRPSEEPNKTIYYTLSLDIHHIVKGDGKDNEDEKEEKKEKEKEKKDVPTGTWKYTGSEKYCVLPIDETTQQFKARNAVEGLYLAYIAVCQHEPEQALHYLREIMNTDGFKGTREELEYIEKIINGVPRVLPEGCKKIKNPSVISVKMHALSIVEHYLAKGNEISLAKEQETESSEMTKAAVYEKEMDKKIAEFHQSVMTGSAYSEWCDEYHHTRQNIASYMRLSEEREYELLRKLKKDGKLTGPLAVRAKELKNYYLSKELAYIKSKDFSSDFFIEQQEQISLKLRKLKQIKFYENELSFVKIPVVTPYSFENNSEQIASFQHIYAALETPSFSRKAPVPNMSDQEFIENFVHYYQVAIKEDTSFKRELYHYCQQVILANKHVEFKKQRSLIPAFAGVLMKIIENPNRFKINMPYKKDGTLDANLWVNDLFRIAASITSAVPTKMLNVKEVEIPYVAPDIFHYLPPIKAIQANSFSFPFLDDETFIQKTGLTEYIEAYKKEKEKYEEIIQKKLSQYDEKKSFEENKEIIQQLDEEIGQLRNELNANLHALSIHYLSDEALRADLFSETKRLTEDVNKRILPLEEDILILANKGPDDLRYKLMFDMQHYGKTRAKLTMSDMYRLYVLADENEYHRITGLSEKEIKQLHQHISDYVMLSILSKNYQTKNDALLKCYEAQNADSYKEELKKLGAMLAQKNVAKFSDHDIQFFQKEEGILIYPQQKYYLEKLLRRDEKTHQYNNEIFQLIMGGGKSKVIAPLNMLKKANGTDLAVIQVKGSLFNTNFSDLNATSMRLFNQEAIPFQFSRHSPCKKEDLKKIYNTFHQTIVNRNYLVTTGESLQSLELKYLELLDSPPPPPLLSGNLIDIEKEKALLEEWKGQIKWLDKTLQMLKNRGERIIDEIHDELNPKKQLNYTLGAPSSIPKEDIRLQIDFFSFFEQVSLSAILGQKNVNLADVAKNNKLVLMPEQWGDIFETLAEQLTVSPLSPVSHIVKKLNLDKAQQHQLKQYLLNRSDAILDKLMTLSERERDEIAFLKIQVSEILPFTIKRDLNENYGPSRSDKLSALERNVPIPYKANNVPNERARFGHFIELMNYTMQMSLQTTLSEEVVNEVINDIVDKAKIEMLEIPGTKFEQTITGILFNDSVREPIDFKRIMSEDKEYCQLVAKQLSVSPSFKKFCLKEYILPKIKLNSAVLSSDTQNLAAMTHTTQGMSGTPYNHRALHQDLFFNEKEGLGTDGETIDIIIKKDTQVAFSEQFSSPYAFLKENYNNIKVEHANDMRAIVDVGALFKGITNQSVAEEIAKFYQEKNRKIKYILYYDNDEDVLYALDAKTNERIKLNTTDKNKISEILKCSPDERFTYYDQAHIEGIDIFQADKAHALVTISEKTMQHSLLQGTLRMRQFAKNQSVTFVVPTYLKSNFVEQSKLKSALDLVRQNTNQELFKIHLKGSHQKFNNVIRKDLLERIYKISDPLAKADCLKKFKRYFSFQYRPNHFINSGAVSTPVRVNAYFDDMEADIVNDWKRVLQDANILFTDEEEMQFKKSVKKVKEQSIASCERFIKKAGSKESVGSNPPESNLGMENENELETELEEEIEQELEKQRLSYDEQATPNEVADFYIRREKGIINENGYLLPLDEALKVDGKSQKFSFSPQLHVTPQFFKTYQTQKKYLGARTKPIEIVMMVRSNQKPYTLDAIVMTKKEADSMMARSEQEKKQLYPNYDIWFVSPRETVLSGHPPKVLPEEYSTLIEQIRYLNGDCRLLSQQNVLTWMNEDTKEKLDFLHKHILPVYPEKASFYKNLALRLDVINKIILEMMNKPYKDYSQVDWSHQYPEFRKLTEKKQRIIFDLSMAFKVLNIKEKEDPDFFEIDCDEWLKSQPKEIAPYLRIRTLAIKDKIKKVKKFREDANVAINKKIPLNTLIKHEKSLLDFNFLNDKGILPLQYAILEKRMDDIDFLLGTKIDLSLKDVNGLSVFDYLLQHYKSDPEFVDLVYGKIVASSVALAEDLPILYRSRAWEWEQAEKFFSENEDEVQFVSIGKDRGFSSFFKMLDRIYVENPEIGKEFNDGLKVITDREGERHILKTLRHEEHKELEFLKALNRVRYLVTVEEDDGSDTSYLIMAPLPRETLAKKLKREKAMSTLDKYKLALNCAEAVLELHKKGLIHENVSAENIVIGPENDTHLINFMSTLRLKPKTTNVTCPVRMGDKKYPPPEIKYLIERGDYKTDVVHSRAIDIYSFGMMLQDMFKLRVPPEWLRNEPGQRPNIEEVKKWLIKVVAALEKGQPVPEFKVIRASVRPENVSFSAASAKKEKKSEKAKEKEEEKEEEKEKEKEKEEESMPNKKDDKKRMRAWEQAERFFSENEDEVLFVSKGTKQGASTFLKVLDKIYVENPEIGKEFNDGLKVVTDKEGKDYSLKILRNEEHKELDFLKNLKRIQYLVTVEEDDRSETSYLIMAPLPRETLAEKLKSEKAMSTLDKHKLALNCAEAVLELHKKGFIHENLNAENIVIGPENDAYVTNFMSALRLKPGKTNVTCPVPKGDKKYLPPEIKHLVEHGDYETGVVHSRAMDIYSFAMMLQDVFQLSVPPKWLSNEPGQRPNIDQIKKWLERVVASLEQGEPEPSFNEDVKSKSSYKGFKK